MLRSSPRCCAATGSGATFFITEGLEFADKERYMDWGEIKGLHDAGFEIGNHHGNHVDVTTQSREEFIRDLEQVERSCVAHGIDVPTTYGYPGGHHDLAAVEALAAKGYRFARRGIYPERPDHIDGAFGRAYAAGCRPSAADTRRGGERRVLEAGRSVRRRGIGRRRPSGRAPPSTGCPITIPGATPIRACSRASSPSSRPTTTR